MKTGKKHGVDIFFFLVLFGVLAAVSLALNPLGLYSNEEGVQFVQMKNFAARGTLAIDYPGKAKGFESRDVAPGHGYFRAEAGSLRAVCPPLLPWLASLLFPVFGDRAVHVLPFFFFFLSTWLLGRTLLLVMERGALYYILLLVYCAGSPVFLRALGFSEFTLSLFIFIGGLFCLANRLAKGASPLWVAGSTFLAGLAVAVRHEFLFVSVAWMAGVVSIFATRNRWREALLALGGGVLSVAALFAHDSLIHGEFPGPYLNLSLGLYHVSTTRIAVLALVGALCVALLSAAGRMPAGSLPGGALRLAPVILLLVIVPLTAARIALEPLVMLFPVFFFILWGLSSERIGERDGRNTLGAVTLLAVMIALFLAASLRSPHHIVTVSLAVTIVPVVIFFLGLAGNRLFESKGMIIVLAFVSVIASVNSLQEATDDVFKFTDYNTRRIEFLQRHTAAGDALIFRDTGSLEHSGPLFFDRIFFVARGPVDEQRMQERLRVRGIGRVYLWTAASPMSIEGNDPYADGEIPRFPMLTSGTRCRRACGGDFFYLIRLDARSDRTARAGTDEPKT